MIAIVDYRAGNLRSVERALNRLGVSSRITSRPEEILEAERLIFPGVGAAGQAMDDLRGGELDLVLRRAFESGKPFLGICLGAQIILEQSEENEAACLGLLPGTARRFPPSIVSKGGERLKIPHMGWNGVRVERSHPVLEAVRKTDAFYFVHAYYPAPDLGRHVIGTTEHGLTFPSVIGTGNLLAMQFHPEKSGIPGLRILDNFCRWDGHYAE